MTRMSNVFRGVRSGLVMLGVVALAGGLAGCGGGSPPPCQTAAITLSWFVSANGQAVSCAQAGASEVDVIVDQMEVPLPCSALSGTTPEFDAGTHTITLELRDSAQNVLSRLPAMNFSFQCGELKNLGTVEFSLTP
jgi:hypothetical protein